MPIRSVLVFVAALSAAAVVPAAAQSKCDAGKLKCVRNKLGCLVKVHETAVKKGLPPDAAKLQKCMDKFDGGATDPGKGCFAKLEAATGSDCSTTGNVAAIESQVDQDVNAYLDALVPATTTTTPVSTTTTTTIGACLADGQPCLVGGDAACCSGCCSGCDGTCTSDPSKACMGFFQTCCDACGNPATCAFDCNCCAAP